MTVHDRVLELAAAALDFPLSPSERDELDEHLATCPACRRAVAALRTDAAAVRTPVTPLPAERAQAIFAGSLRRRRSGPPVRMLAIAALFALGAGAALAVGAQLLEDTPTETPPIVVRPSETPSPEPSTSAPPSPSLAPTAGPTTPPSQPTNEPTNEPTPSATPQPPVTAGPIQADARNVGAGIRLAPAPAPDGGAFVSVPRDGETVVFRLDADGAIASGWPVALPSAPCARPLAAEDGSVRVVCYGPLDELGQPGFQLAYGFDRGGGALAGWPVEVPCCVESTFQPGPDQEIDGTTLRFVATRYTTDALVPGEPVGVNQLVEIDAAGRVAVGAEIERFQEQVAVVLGPGRVGYIVQVAYVDDKPSMEATAFDAGGDVEDWSVALGDWSSPPAFLPDGRIAFATTADGTARLIVRNANGTESSTVDLPMELRIPWSGAGDFLYAPILVAPDGSLRIVGGSNEIWAVDPDTGVLEGWPWTAPSSFQQSGFCSPEDTGCGQADAERAIGPDGQVVVALEATDTGGVLMSVGPDGQVVEGWPVTLNREEAAFWSVVTGETGTTYALAIEPEDGGGFSGTVLAIDPDSTVRWATTLVEP